MARILLTAGPTRAYIDDVRFLTNASSGRMAAALAQAVAMLDAALGPAVAVVVPNAPLGLKTPGDLTAATTPALRDAWMAALGDGKGAVVLDLESTHHMDALGLSLVLGLFKTCQSRGRPFSVDGIGPQLQPVFRRLNLTRLFPVKGGSL